VHVVIMGCGRVGSTLALSLEQQGHSVAIIDQDPSAFRRLGTGFNGRRVEGFGFDRRTLAEADISSAYAFAAVSSGDNSNIIAARVARETFDVDNVVARIYDPGRAEIYQRLGIPTVATVKWTADQVLQRLLPQGSVPVYTDVSGRVVIAEVPLNAAWVGTSYDHIAAITGTRVAYVTRLGEGTLPEPDMVHQEGDLVHLIASRDRLMRVEQQLADAPTEED
jgi:trk system potassium uptake protein